MCLTDADDMNDLTSLDWALDQRSKKSQSLTTNANYHPVYERQNNPFSLNTTGTVAVASISNSPEKGSTGNITPTVKSDDLFNGLVDFGKRNGPVSMAQQAGKYSYVEVKATKLMSSNATAAEKDFRYAAPGARCSLFRGTPITTLQHQSLNINALQAAAQH